MSALPPKAPMVYRSPHPPVDIPDTALADFVLARAAARGDRPALIDSLTGRTITYANLADLVDRAAAALQRRHVAKGDVCAVFSPNTPEYMIAVLAIARLRAVVTTANPMNTREELARQLADSRARMLITTMSLADTWTDAAAQAGVEQVLTFDSPPAGVQERFTGLAISSSSPAGRRRSTSIQTTSSHCPTRAERPAFRKASSSRTATSSQT